MSNGREARRTAAYVCSRGTAVDPACDPTRRLISRLPLALSIAALRADRGWRGFSAASRSVSQGSGTGGSGAGTQTGLGGTGGPGASAGATGGSSVDAGAPTPTLTDFSATPIVDPSAPPNAAALFDGSPPRADGAPSVTAPVAGTLMPRNWLRPRFELGATAGENLFEIDLSVAGFAQTLADLHGDPELRPRRERPGTGGAGR